MNSKSKNEPNNLILVNLKKIITSVKIGSMKFVKFPVLITHIASELQDEISARNQSYNCYHENSI